MSIFFKTKSVSKLRGVFFFLACLGIWALWGLLYFCSIFFFKKKSFTALILFPQKKYKRLKIKIFMSICWGVYPFLLLYKIYFKKLIFCIFLLGYCDTNYEPCPLTFLYSFFSLLKIIFKLIILKWFFFSFFLFDFLKICWFLNYIFIVRFLKTSLLRKRLTKLIKPY